MIYLETKNITYIPEVTTNLNANPSLSKQNIQLAQQAISYTNAVLPKGAGNVVNRIVSHLDVGAMRMDAATRLYALPIMPIIPIMTLPPISLAIALKYSTLIPLLIPAVAGISSLAIISQPAFFEQLQLETFVTVAKSYKIGNCGEHAMIAFDYLKKANTSSRVEIIADFANDHAFVVIDRNSTSSLDDPKTWGPSAIVCDPWAGEYFPATELKEKLHQILTTHLLHPPSLFYNENFKVLHSFDNRFEDSILSSVSQYAAKSIASALCLDLIFSDFLYSCSDFNFSNLLPQSFLTTPQLTLS